MSSTLIMLIDVASGYKHVRCVSRCINSCICWNASLLRPSSARFKVLLTTKLAESLELTQDGMAMFSCLQGNDFTKFMPQLRVCEHMHLDYLAHDKG